MNEKMRKLKYMKNKKVGSTPIIYSNKIYYKLEMFRPIINKYGWELTEIVSGLYNDKAQELCFNLQKRFYLLCCRL